MGLLAQAHLSKRFPKVFRQERVQQRVDAGARVRQHVGDDLERNLKVRIGYKDLHTL